MTTLRDRCAFVLERWIQKGVRYQLLLMSGLIAAVAILGGCAAWLVSDAFGNLAEAVWWSFLRLTDPGYLGDDEGAALRVVSTVVTVSGYVLFMGSLIAILTQWLSAKMTRLELGLSPIAMRQHFVVLGWTNRTPEIVARLLGGRGRLERFLARRSVRRLRIVVLADAVSTSLRHELRDYLGDAWSEDVLFLRSGSALEPEHLERLDLARAAAIVVPGSDFELGGAEATDARVVKALLTIERLLDTDRSTARPNVVAEIFDPRRVPIARTTMREGLEVVPTDSVISRLMSQSLRHRDLGRVLLGILGHREPGSLYLRAFPELTGSSPGDLFSIFPRAVVIGAVRAEGGTLRACLNPPPDFRLEPGDLLVLLSESYDDCTPSTRTAPEPARRTEPPVSDAVPEEPRRVLVFGWSNKVLGLLGELTSRTSERFDVVNVSRTPASERKRAFSRLGLDGARVRVRCYEGDFTALQDLVELDPRRFDNVLFLASAVMESSEEADARTILGRALLRSLVAEAEDGPDVLIELLDPKNERLLEGGHDLVLVSSRVLSQILTHVALRPELNAVLEALFRSGGPEIVLRPTAAYGLGRATTPFHALQARVLAHGDTLVGLYRGAGHGGPRLHLAPAGDTTWDITDEDAVIVLTTVSTA